MDRTDVLVVGAGAAGVGVGLALKRLGLDFRIVDRYGVGASFRRWPRETRFITPSFTANAFALPDLNALSPETSPAHTLGLERLSGPEYARYLSALVRHYELPILEKTAVRAVKTLVEGFRIQTSRGLFGARFLVWATGEFQFPRAPYLGAELGLHYGKVRSWAALKGEEFTVVGGYESGVDAAYHLLRLGKRVTLLDPAAPWRRRTGEPSIDLSPYTRERLLWAMETGRLRLVRARVERIGLGDGLYWLHHSRGVLSSPTPPILATGFEGGFAPVRHLFGWEGAFPLLSEAADESTLTPGLFLVGPRVKHRGAAFCFIYKFRGRFPMVARAIAERLSVDAAPLEGYRQKGMWVDDLESCCALRCAC